MMYSNFDSLNGASIDTPEWNFSKMMRSAKIRFADFSIIRLIQILGNYGNWRQVLQVIEWMQARERFKSNRIRFDFWCFNLIIYLYLY